MAGEEERPKERPRGRLSWQAATLLIAVLSIGAWAGILLLTRWLSH
ncbi:MAG: hypothetical protein K5Q68_14470 [Roseococcus sp.]|nr:hypothetical protein [Roseococcus sp.]